MNSRERRRIRRWWSATAGDMTTEQALAAERELRAVLRTLRQLEAWEQTGNRGRVTPCRRCERTGEPPDQCAECGGRGTVSPVELRLGPFYVDPPRLDMRGIGEGVRMGRKPRGGTETPSWTAFSSEEETSPWGPSDPFAPEVVP